MQSRSRLGVVGIAIYAVFAFLNNPARACLRDTLDDRAVQWSTLIVMADLTQVHDPVPLPSDAKPSNFQYQMYDFKVTSPIDGAGKVGDSFTVVRFLDGPGTLKSSICGQAFTPRQVGKSFLLMLRPESDVQWADRENAPDPRTADFHALKAYMVVHLELASDLGQDGIDDAKYTVTSTRTAEAQFKDADAKLQIQTLVNAQDDTEESQAEKAILDMGPKAIPALKAYMSQVDEDGQARIRRVIRQLAPPSVLGSIHEH
jgi:hypothetical protein